MLILVAIAVQTLGAIVYQSLGVAGPFLVDQLNLSNVAFGLLPSAMHVGSLAALIVSAALLDRLGPTRLLGLGSLLCGAMLLTGALGGSYLVLAACLTVVGAVWGMSAIAGGETIVLSAPPRHRATITSVRQLALPLGGLIAALLGPVAVFVGWQGLMVGQAVAFVVVGAFILRTRLLPVHRHRKTPWLQIPTRRGAMLGALAIGLTGAQAAFLVYAVLELTGRVGLGFSQAALLFVAAQGMGAICRVFLGVISDATPVSRTSLLALNSLAAATATVGFGLLQPDWPAWIIISSVLAAAGLIIGWNGVLVVAILEADGADQVNRNLGGGMMLMRIGIIVGPPVFGMMLTWFGSAVAWSAVAAVFLVVGALFAVMGPGLMERKALA